MLDIYNTFVEFVLDLLWRPLRVRRLKDVLCCDVLISCEGRVLYFGSNFDIPDEFLNCTSAQISPEQDDDLGCYLKVEI